ncbi:tRNA lysidine(34) synthetase TilS [[Clostridium] aminophilum]|uniref:tRNA(Ile)-lysidine synthase n=1 Tax=[Clostridium] aminophilum TaxID=1526 RepID=A0A1I6JXM1_9FIRM|nr:tRNA lysidine(34) synthetase TilS [[Clostridium] aminophilum]SFR83701.1 tRNA(Ile)-lysidine synthase [[Clostridium] aminophilum]
MPEKEIHPLEKRVYDRIREQNMLLPGDGVIIGLSAGPDSACLLSVLCALSGRLNIEVRAVHVHHGLRGEEADRDAAAALRLAGSFGVRCGIVRIDAAKEAEKNGTTVEEAGRNARYRIFREEKERWEAERGIPDRGNGMTAGGFDLEKGPERPVGRIRIATAHHADDSSETVLMNLFRGTGLRGLTGIPAMTGEIVRPLIGEYREDILAYLKDKAVPWVTDSTNLNTEITRNYIRHEILPGVRKNVNARAAEHILQAAEDIAQADAYFRELAGQYCGRLLAGKNPAPLGADPGALPGSAPELAVGTISGSAPEEAAGTISGEAPGNGFDRKMFRIRCSDLPKTPEILRGYLVREILRRIGCPAKDIGRTHIKSILDILDGGTGRSVNLPYGVRVEREYEDAVFYIAGPGQEPQSKMDPETMKEGSGEKRTPDEALEACFRTEIISAEEAAKNPDTTYTKCFDYDKIQGNLSFRYRTEGDRIRLSEQMSKSLHRLMIDEKVPRQERSRIPIVTDGAGVLWAVGYRTGWNARVTEQTETILRITYNGGKDGG